ncbi:adenosylcobinamide amidohydrolase [uncultured Methanobrevibacter sp.]|uniref:adenosylcobinamide amidohydrolase n=1 Tax=uncultured Methanobrevibacter sp. TaxID=253161 RepID=UPI002615EB45|nr:adenosylcobinamide amidohydrolase [uncultured Methanobrevibacter sp.]
MQTKKLIFKNSTGDRAYIYKDSIVVDFGVCRNGISTSDLNGGYSSDFKSVFNHYLSQENINFLENHSVYEYLLKHCGVLEIDYKYTTGLLTSAKMENACVVTKYYKNLEVSVITTAGVRVNASRAGDPASYYEENAKFHFDVGTINSIILTNVSLEPGTLGIGLMTATEAKAVALNNLRIPSQFSNGFATGTGTDGVAIFSNIGSDNVLSNAGKHSKLGELIANCVIESVTEAIKRQVWITNKSQCNVLARLTRYKLDINEFYDNLDEDKENFIKSLQISARKQNNVALTSSILNLIDEVENGLINKKTAYNLAKNILNNDCEDYYILKILNFWIDKFLS